jgi:hypothetical protein
MPETAHDVCVTIARRHPLFDGFLVFTAVAPTVDAEERRLPCNSEIGG